MKNHYQQKTAPAAVFINLTDERYTKMMEPRQPGSTLLFNLTGVNNLTAATTGTVRIKLIDQKGRNTSEQTIPVKLDSYVRTNIPSAVVLPLEPGGYAVVAEFTPENSRPVISRRFLKVGQAEKYHYFELNP